MALQLLLLQRAMRRERVFRDRLNPLERYDDHDFLYRYRLPKVVVLEIVDNIGAHLERTTRRSGAVPAVLQVCVTLQFLDCANFQRSAGDIHGISKATVSRSIRRVISAIAAKAKDYIKFSERPVDVHRVKRGYDEYAGFPNVIGSIDGTQIAIKAPSEEEWLFVNRKGYHSINVQVFFTPLCLQHLFFNSMELNYYINHFCGLKKN